MTPRELTPEEVEALLSEMAHAPFPAGAEQLAAYTSALRARAEAAEADNAALGALVTERGCLDLGPTGSCNEQDWPDTASCPACRASRSAHPGTGYRAKVRAELLREQAEYHRAVASFTSPDAAAMKSWHEADAKRLEAQATREEQG